MEKINASGKIVFGIFSLLMIIPFVSDAQSLLNLDVAKNQVKNYYESGQYNRHIDSILKKAEVEIESVELPSNPVVIFDVDDTALSSYDYTKSLGFGFTWRSWIKWMKGKKSKAIKPVENFYYFLKKRKIRIIFLTGRDSSLSEATRENLIEQGYLSFDSLICRGQAYKGEPASKFKEEIRTKLVKKGFGILASIGDQKSDLQGADTGIKIKLPNFLYIIK